MGELAGFQVQVPVPDVLAFGQIALEVRGFEVPARSVQFGRVALEVRSFSANQPSAPCPATPCLPELFAVEATGPTTVRVRFNKAMTADSALYAIANYVLSASGGATARSVSAIKVPEACGDPSFVDLTLSGEMTAGVNNYTLVVSNVRDIEGSTIDPAHDTVSFNGLGMPPVPTGATATAQEITKVRVTFSELVDPTTAQNAANYTISGGVTVQAALLLNDGKSVDLTVAGQVAGTQYILTVIGVKDLAGNPVS